MQAGGLHGVWLGVQYIWRLEGRKNREVGLAKAASGPSHASVTPRLLLHLCLCLCPSPCPARLFLLPHLNIQLQQPSPLVHHMALSSNGLFPPIFHSDCPCLVISFVQEDDEDRAYDNQGGMEGTGHTRYMGPPLTPGPQWSALSSTTPTCAFTCNRLI